MALPRDEERIREELLVIRCRQGDRQALGLFFECWENRLLFYLRRLLPQEADAWDALQLTWSFALKDFRHLRDPRSVRLWIYRLARRAAAKYYRGQPPWKTVEQPVEMIDESQAVEERFLVQEDVERLYKALNQLSLPHREILTLRFLEEMPLEELCQLLNIPLGTAKSRLHYAKLALKALLEPDSTSISTNKLT